MYNVSMLIGQDLEFNMSGIFDEFLDIDIPIAKGLVDLGFSLVATGGTQQTLSEAGVSVSRINKVLEGSPHVVDAMINGEIDLMIWGLSDNLFLKFSSF